MAKGPGKGVSGNPAGKPKGTKNKLPVKVKEMMANFLEDNYDGFVKDFTSLKNPAEKCKLYLETAKFIIPKPKDPEEEDENDRRHKQLLDRLFPLRDD